MSKDDPEDPMVVSGPVPVADLAAANAVIDQERAENARLRVMLKAKEESVAYWKEATQMNIGDAEARRVQRNIFIFLTITLFFIAGFLALWVSQAEEVSDFYRVELEKVYKIRTP